MSMKIKCKYCGKKFVTETHDNGRPKEVVCEKCKDKKGLNNG